MIKIAVCDDQNEICDQLKKYLKRLSEEENYDIGVDIYNSGEKLLMADYNQYNAIFLDIDMGKKNGIDIAGDIRLINDKVAIIFLTALAQYATAGYRVKAYRFLIKPLEYDSMLIELGGLFNKLNFIDNNYIETDNNGYRFHIDISDIVYIEAQNHTLRYHLRYGDIEAAGTLKGIEERVNICDLVRIHKSYVINMNYIEKVSWSNVIMNCGKELNIARSKACYFKKRYMEYLESKLG